MAPLFFWTLLVSVLAYAFLRGGIEHKLASVGCLVATLATHLVRPASGDVYATVESGALWVDAALFALFLTIALRSNRFWPLWVAGFHLVTVASHGLRAIRLDLIPTVYAVAAQFWSYPVLLVIAVAIWRAHRREISGLLGSDVASGG